MGLMLYTGDIKLNKMFPGYWVRRLQFRGLSFIIMVNAKHYAGIEEMHSDSVAGMTSQRRVCSPAQRAAEGL